MLGQDNRAAQAPGQSRAVLHDPTHQPRILEAGTVIGKDPDTGIDQFTHWCHVVTGSTHRHGR